jgi:hypothetical protein
MEFCSYGRGNNGGSVRHDCAGEYVEFREAVREAAKMPQVPQTPKKHLQAHAAKGKYCGPADLLSGT